MPEPLPEVLNTYFEALNARRLDVAAACFAEDAVVHDEAEDHVGTVPIRFWIENTVRKYDFKAEPLSTGERQANDGSFRVPCRVSGNFPGSPIELDYLFTLRDGRIQRLGIE